MLVEGVKLTLAIAKTEALTRLGTKFWDEVPIPGCEHTDLWSDEYWTCMCRQYTSTLYHYSGVFIPNHIETNVDGFECNDVSIVMSFQEL